MNKKLLVPYLNEKEYRNDLKRVLMKDYEIKLSRKDLKRAAKNIEELLKVFFIF